MREHPRPSIINFLVIADINGTTGYECYMSDQSTWRCDKDMKNWRKVGSSLQEMQAAFEKGED